ncbi:MAG: GAF domain-containing protein [Actinomycetaceae bacterium]|nr:GAF domain-containing protein [Actinomycetaceae bacterium]
MQHEEHAEERTQAARVLSMALKLTTQLDRQEILKGFIESSASITGARYGAVGVFDEQGETVNFMWTGIPQEQAAKIGHPPEGHGVFADIPDNHFLIVNDMTHYINRFPWPEHHPIMENFLGAPVRIGGRVFGRLYLSDKPGGFSRIDGRNCELLAQAVAIAVQNSDVLASIAAKGDEERQQERVSIAGTLEKSAANQLDTSSQSLIQVRDELAAQAQVPQSVLNRLDVAIRSIDDSSEKIRSIISSLNVPENE